MNRNTGKKTKAKLRSIKNILKIAAFILILTVMILFAGCEFLDNIIADDDDTNAGDDGQNNDEDDNNNDGDNADIIDSPDEKVELGYRAPDFKVELLSGGTESLSDYRGKVVMINFWATWCGPCINEMPDIQELSKAYADDLIVLAVNCSEDKEKVGQFVNDNEYTFKIGLDPNGVIQKKYPTQGIPYTIIINSDGIITEIRLGGGNNMFAVYEQFVKDALGIIEN